MATSGSIDFALNARQICTFALEELRLIGSGQDPDADDMEKARVRLNMMLKSWQLTGPNLWRQTEGTVTLVANTSSYVLSPKPFKVVEARYRDASSRDLPMIELTRQEYIEFPLKTSTGIPTQYYVDRQRSASTMYVWPVPAAVTIETIKYTYQRAFEDIDSLDNDLDIPSEHLETVGVSLAVRCMNIFAKTDPLLLKRADELVFEASQSDREEFVRFVPDRTR